VIGEPPLDPPVQARATEPSPALTVVKTGRSGTDAVRVVDVVCVVAGPVPTAFTAATDTV
jgi:hypothetical protein